MTDDYDAHKKFDVQIAPLLDQISTFCSQYGFPCLLAVQVASEINAHSSSTEDINNTLGICIALLSGKLKISRTTNTSVSLTAVNAKPIDYLDFIAQPRKTSMEH